MPTWCHARILLEETWLGDQSDCNMSLSSIKGGSGQRLVGSILRHQGGSPKPSRSLLLPEESRIPWEQTCLCILLGSAIALGNRPWEAQLGANTTVAMDLEHSSWGSCQSHDL